MGDGPDVLFRTDCFIYLFTSAERTEAIKHKQVVENKRGNIGDKYSSVRCSHGSKSTILLLCNSWKLKRKMIWVCSGCVTAVLKVQLQKRWRSFMCLGVNE